MINSNIVFIGLDTHIEFTEVAYIKEKRNAKITHIGRVPAVNFRLRSSCASFSQSTFMQHFTSSTKQAHTGTGYTAYLPV